MEINIKDERKAFENAWLVPHELEFFDFDLKKNQYLLKEQYVSDDESPIANETYHSLNSGWSMWLKAKVHEAVKLNGCVVVPVDQAKDTERLNFLLEDSPTRTICQHTHWSEDGELIAEGQCVAEIYYISGWDYIRESISETKRQAIDKAILEAARGGNE